MSRRGLAAWLAFACSAALSLAACADTPTPAAPSSALPAVTPVVPPPSISPADCPPVARTPSAEELARFESHARDRGFLWRLRKGGHTSWLYGTIHVARMEWMTPGPRVAAALKASDVVAFELDITDPGLMQRLQEGVGAGAQQALGRVPDDLAQRLQRQLRVACAPDEMLTSMAPEMLGAALMMMSVRRDGLDASYGIDPALALRARRLGKSVVSLETPELQLGLMSSATPADLRETLEKVLSDLEQDRARPMLLRVADVWAEGRTRELQRYRDWCDCANTAYERASLKALLDDRNGPMADRIDALHQGGKSVFVAVGSLHMFGPAALPTLMARRGYRVERIDFKAP